MSSLNQTTPVTKSIAQKGAKLLNAFLFEQTGEPGNQRKDLPRDPVAGEVVVVQMHPKEGEPDRSRVFIRDISPGGCGLWSRVRIEPGSNVLVMFQGPDGQPTQRTGRVRHCRGQEGTGFAVGVRFDREKKG